MTTLSATAFKWSGTGYNSTYDTSHKVTLTDDDDQYQGSGDTDERVSIDGGSDSSSLYSPYAIDVSFTDTSGEDHVETFYFFNTSGDWYFIPGADSQFTEGAQLGSYQSHTVGWEYSSAVCFAGGTRILTKAGSVPVETLKPGALIRVLDGDCRPLRMQIVREISIIELASHPQLRPIRIARGALGPGLPSRDLLVSRQHRMLANGPICQRMFGTDEVLIPAHRLTALPGCRIEPPEKPLTYHHLVFDRHEVVFAEGAPSESFFPGPQALRTIPSAARAELFNIFPDALNAQQSAAFARQIPPGSRQMRLLARILKNQHPFFEPSATHAVRLSAGDPAIPLAPSTHANVATHLLPGRGVDGVAKNVALAPR